jgi:simple sugar transport system permease protein
MSADATLIPPAKPRQSGSNRWLRRHALQIGITAVAFAIWLLFLFGATRTFTSREIYAAFMSTTPFFGIIALPLTMVVITGEIDLSFPSIMSLGMLTFSTVLMMTANPWIALVACLATGLAAGLFNGFLISWFLVPSLVVTIGTQFLWRGAVQVLTGGNGMSLVATRDTPFYNLFVGRIAGWIPMQFIWMIIIAILVWILLNRHRFGAHVYLIGDNADSAKLMGVNVGSTKTIVYGITGLAAAFAGLVVSLELSYYWPTLGEGYLLNTLSSVFLGGTSVFGGTGTIYGTFVASFIVGAISAGIVAIGWSGFWTQFIYGMIIVISVIIQAYIGRRLG